VHVAQLPDRIVDHARRRDGSAGCPEGLPELVPVAEMVVRNQLAPIEGEREVNASPASRRR
jgi:hypothetical protein